jgi:hypothetical protein
MGDAIVIEHENRLYKIAVGDLAQYEVADEATKNELLAEGEAQSDGSDEVEGFAARSSIFLIRR